MNYNTFVLLIIRMLFNINLSWTIENDYDMIIQLSLKERPSFQGYDQSSCFLFLLYIFCFISNKIKLGEKCEYIFISMLWKFDINMIWEYNFKYVVFNSIWWTFFFHVCSFSINTRVRWCQHKSLPWRYNNVLFDCKHSHKIWLSLEYEGNYNQFDSKNAV